MHRTSKLQPGHILKLPDIVRPGDQILGFDVPGDQHIQGVEGVPRICRYARIPPYSAAAAAPKGRVLNGNKNLGSDC